jgi:hypothetical protein
MDDEAIAAILRLVNQNIGALESVGMLLALLIEIERHAFAAVLAFLVVGLPLARHRDD